MTIKLFQSLTLINDTKRLNITVIKSEEQRKGRDLDQKKTE